MYNLHVICEKRVSMFLIISRLVLLFVQKTYKTIVSCCKHGYLTNLWTDRLQDSTGTRSSRMQPSQEQTLSPWDSSLLPISSSGHYEIRVPNGLLLQVWTKLSFRMWRYFLFCTWFEVLTSVRQVTRISVWITWCFWTLQYRNTSLKVNYGSR